MKSFADPDTHYELLTRPGPEQNNGPVDGKPTGEVKCLGTCADGSACGGVAMNVDDLPHDPTCDQRFAHSRWYVEMLDGRCGENPRARIGAAGQASAAGD